MIGARMVKIYSSQAGEIRSDPSVVLALLSSRRYGGRTMVTADPGQPCSCLLPDGAQSELIGSRRG
jgi:hypothetical protein